MVLRKHCRDEDQAGLKPIGTLDDPAIDGLGNCERENPINGGGDLPEPSTPSMTIPGVDESPRLCHPTNPSFPRQSYVQDNSSCVASSIRIQPHQVLHR